MSQRWKKLHVSDIFLDQPFQLGVEEDQLCLAGTHWETRMIFTIGLGLQQDLKVDALKLEVVFQVIFFYSQFIMLGESEAYLYLLW
jgi:hypothetical protein